MATSYFNLKNFKSEILAGKGLSRTNRFEILIPPPLSLSDKYAEGLLASSYIEQSSLPPLNIAVKPFKIFGPTYQRPLTSEYGGEGINVIFHVDRNLSIKKFFEDWMHVIVNPDTYTVGYQEEYITTVSIRQLDEKNNITYEIQLFEAFPRNMNLMELNNASSNQTHRLSVLFSYRYWKDPSKLNLNDTPLLVTNPGVPRVDNRVVIPNPINPAIVPSAAFGTESPAYDYQDKTNISAVPAA